MTPAAAHPGRDVREAPAPRPLFVALLAVALFAVALSFAFLVLMRRFLGWALPDDIGRFTLIRGVSAATPLFEVLVNMVPALFAGVFGILLANRLTAPRDRPSLALVLIAFAIIAALTVAMLLVSTALAVGAPLGILAIGFGAAIGMLLPAIH